jgi:hypothetical protein
MIVGQMIGGQMIGGKIHVVKDIVGMIVLQEMIAIFTVIMIGDTTLNTIESAGVEMPAA